MVPCPNNPTRMLSPRPTQGDSLRGVTKHTMKSRLGTMKSKKAQRALCTIFEESALTASSPLYTLKGTWMRSPNGTTSRRNKLAVHPALGRLRLQEFRETPTTRRATPTKERHLALGTAFGRHHIKAELDALADEFGTCHLQSALNPELRHAAAALSQSPVALERKSLVPMLED